MSDNEQPDDSQKTEEPTPKKLEESRKKGQVAMSREVSNWVMLFMGSIVVLAFGPKMMENLMVHMSNYIVNAHSIPGVPGGMEYVFVDSFWHVMGILFVPLGLLMFAAFAGPFLQVGPLFAPEAVKPDIKKISPIEGFKRLFSVKSLVEFAKGILKIGLIGLVGVILLIPFFGTMEHMIGMPIVSVLGELHSLVFRLMAGVLVVLMIIAMLDLVFQRQQHYQKMRMTKQELKDEYKQAEGDPHIKAKLRQLRQEKARTRMMQAVPEADVVITNPTHFSIALKYNPEEMAAPVVIAKGVDELAMRIREVAKEHDIILMENPPLARVLYDTVEIDQVIPEEQYQAVAEIISFVFKQKGK
ncbi:MAG: flagellar biosynthesis protein FlhB, partial [Pseudomonadota bacterium]